MDENTTAVPDEVTADEPELREFKVESTDKEAAHEELNKLMAEAGFQRISGDNYDEEGVVAAWGWDDLDGDGEVG